MNLVPFLSKQVSDPWSVDDEKLFKEHGSYQDDVLYVSSIHAKLRLIEKNMYLCSIKTKKGSYVNFHILPDTRGSFYFLAYIPQIGLVHKLKEAGVSYYELPDNSFFRDLLSSYNKYCEYGYDIDDDEYITNEHLLIKVNAPFSDFLDKYNLGILNFEIQYQYNILKTYYKDILHDYSSIIHISSIQSKFLKYNISRSLLNLGKRILITNLVGIAIDNIVDWDGFGGTSIDYNADFDSFDFDSDYFDTDGFEGTDVNSTISSISFQGSTPSFDTGKDVHVVCDSGKDKGYFDVFLNEGKKYIKIGNGSSSDWSNWVLIQGKQRFFWKGNWYIIK